jgi:nucleoside-diphosphate-sugar epimerase
MKYKYLITGAAGFIGSHAGRKLIELGHEVVAPIKNSSDTWRIKDIKNKLTVVRTDLTNFNSVKRILLKHKPDYIIHLATRGVYPHHWKDRIGILVGNYQMTVNLLEASLNLYKVQKIKGIVDAGSVFEYGVRSGSVKEEDVDLVDNINPYAASKKATTALVHSPPYNQLPITTLRFFTAYGPYGARTRFIEGTVLRCLNNEDIEIASQKVVRDFVFADDIAESIILALNNKESFGQIINIGSGVERTLKEVSEMIKEKTNSDVSIVGNPKYNRPNESRCWANISKAKKLLGWEPKHDLEEALDITINWYRKNQHLVPQSS